MAVLLALDESAQAMDEALRIARERGEALTALFVQDATWHDYLGSDWLSGSNSRGGYIEWAAGHDIRESEEVPRLLLEKAGDQNVAVKVTAGRVPEEILKELGAGDYSMLVMAHPFRRGLEVLRDTAGSLLKKLPCSLHLVHEPVPEK
ncbi:universal stress protein [Fundidesulfovibrio terrae]|uniref:universal stress protein n=1 Tax=Fundidesulfovibrio terrae TaxID=2922866 RepID=UPI001FAEED3A|nr:universal stress protein [Fundidesulfovibrio terrae]